MSETNEMSWTVCPWRERILVSVLALVLVTGIAVLFAFAAGAVYWGILAFLVLLLSVRTHYQSTSYRLDETGVSIETRWKKKHKPWTRFRSFRIDKDSLVLSPFKKHSWLEPYRGERLRLSRDPSEARRLVSRYLVEQEPRAAGERRGSAEGGSPAEALSAYEEEMLERVAGKIVSWRMSVPAVLFLETGKPLSFLGSQALIFLEPFVRSVFTVPDYEKFSALVERRENVELLIRKIEAKEEEIKEEERKEKLRRKKCRQRT